MTTLPAIDLPVTAELKAAAAETLWFFRGSSEAPLATAPSSFNEQLLVLACRADPLNLAKIGQGFPEHAACVHLAKHTVTGMDTLREWAGA